MKHVNALHTRFAGGYQFLLMWLRHPRSIGAVAPSGTTLATTIADEVDFAAPGAVVEIGAGTGNITRALVDGCARTQTRLIVVEREAGFCRLLRQRFPQATVIQGDARHLPALLRKIKAPPVKAVVSGLPLLSFSPAQRHRIVRQAVDVLAPHGVFLQFTYGPTSPVGSDSAGRCGLVGRRSSLVWRNLPPASLWRYRFTPPPGTHPPAHARPVAGTVAAFTAKS